MPNINEFSYDGAAGEFVEIRVDAGADVSNLDLEIYEKSGPIAVLDQTISVGSGTFYTDGTYDYYVISTSLGDGPRAAIALVDNGILIESVTWGATSPVTVAGGSLDGTTQPSIGDPLGNSSTDSLVTDGSGGWTTAPPTEGGQNICLTSGTLIETANGEVPIEDLQPGMQVVISGGGHQTVRWIGRRMLDAKALRKRKMLRPIRIVAGSLGAGLPKRDLLVSRQHRLLVRSPVAKRMFDSSEVLVSAIKLTEIDGVFVDETVDNVEYIHLLFDKHEIILAEGTPTESLFTGPEALKSLNAEARAELLELFPEITRLDYAPNPARFIPPGRLQKKLVARHVKNGKPIMA